MPERARVEPTDPLPFEAVFHACAPFVWRMLRQVGVRDADLHDVSQEVFLVVHRKLATFDGTSALRTWVCSIALRVASDYRRRAHHRRERVGEDLPEPAMPPPQLDDLERSRALAWLDGVLDTLDEQKRVVFVLFEIEEMPMSEVARAAGCPLQTAYSRLYAARRHVEAAARREQAKRSCA